jgi:hypothetical protein
MPTERSTLMPCARRRPASEAPKPEHRRHQAVEQEQSADDPADVEQVGGPLLAGAAALLLGGLGLADGCRRPGLLPDALRSGRR